MGAPLQPRFAVVPSDGKATATVSDRIRRLQNEARSLASEHVADLMTALGDVQRLAAEIAAGGEAYPVGVREMARRLAEDVDGTTQSLNAVRCRS